MVVGPLSFSAAGSWRFSLNGVFVWPTSYGGLISRWLLFPLCAVVAEIYGLFERKKISPLKEPQNAGLTGRKRDTISLWLSGIYSTSWKRMPRLSPSCKNSGLNIPVMAHADASDCMNQSSKFSNLNTVCYGQLYVLQYSFPLKSSIDFFRLCASVRCITLATEQVLYCWDF